MTAEEFTALVPEFKPRVWVKDGKRRVYLTPPGWKVDAGYVDFSGPKPLICFQMDSADAATIRKALS